MLNTGAMYRAVGAAAAERELALTDGPACAEVARSLDLDMDGAGRILARGQVVDMDALLGEEQGAWASSVALLPQVRDVLVAVQQAIGQRWDLVTEGRDTTTVVFPNAEHKFFVTASLAERARRRLGQTGFHKNLEQIMADVQQRDRQDKEREVAPLLHAPDAVEVLTDGLSIDQVVELVLNLIRRKDASASAASGESKA